MHIYPILDHSGVSLTENSIIVKGTLLCKLSSIFLLVINRSFQQQMIGASGVNSSTDLSTYLPICLLETCLFIGTIWYNQSGTISGTIHLSIYLSSTTHLFGSIDIYLFIWYYPSIHLVLPVCLAQTICTSDTICINLFIHLSIHPSIDISDTFYLVLFI